MMDLSKYRGSNFEYIQNWLKREPEANISEISLATGVPVIAVCHFVGEIKGFTPELLGVIERLMKFYGITEVIGQQ